MALPALITVGALFVGSKIGKAVGSRIADVIAAGGGGRRRAADPVIEHILAGDVGPVTRTGQLFTEGADIDILSQGFPPGTKLEVDPATGEIRIVKRRRRRKRLLTCGDKADIAFLTGTLGKGQLAQGAITSLLSKCG